MNAGDYIYSVASFKLTFLYPNNIGTLMNFIF